MRNNMFPNTLIDEVMAQPFYPAEDEVSFDSQAKRDTLTMPHTLQSDSQQEMDRNLGCINPGGEIKSKGRVPPSRKRVQLAVSHWPFRTRHGTAKGDSA